MTIEVYLAAMKERHIHDGATGEVTSGQPMSISAVLDEIAGRGL